MQRIVTEEEWKAHWQNGFIKGCEYDFKQLEAQLQNFHEIVGIYLDTLPGGDRTGLAGTHLLRCLENLPETPVPQDDWLDPT